MELLKKNDRPVISQETLWAEDKLGRRKVAEYLTPVLASIQQPFAISLNSPFGTGKSFFLECWKVDLQNQGYRVVLFNAWETDFSQDALLAFMSVLKQQFEDREGDTDSAATRERIKKLTNIVGGFMRKELFPLAARILIRKLIGETEAQSLLNGVGIKQDEIEDLLGQFAAEGIKNQEAAENAQKGFRTYLADTVERIAGKAEELGKRKIIVFVDELDRCKPTYAIQVLETIKHFFSVPGLAFVIAIDKEQLQNTIRSVYGAGMDADGYLRRFIDWQFALPLPSHKAFCEYLCEKFDWKSLPSLQAGRHNNLQDFSAIFATLSESFGFSLRKIEHCFTEINLASRSLSNQQNPLIEISGAVSAIMHALPDELAACFNESITTDKFLELLFERVTYRELRKNSLSKDRLKCVLHTWFLNEESSRALFAEQQTVSHIFNSLSSKPSEQEKLRPKLEHIGHVLDLYKTYSFNLFIGEKSLARISYERLTGASKYLQ